MEQTLSKQQVIENFKKEILIKKSKTGRIDWLNNTFNNCKTFNEYKSIILEEIQRLDCVHVTEYFYLLENNLSEKPKCLFCDKKTKYLKYQKGYTQICCSDECRSKIKSARRLGCKATESCKKKISEANKGKILSQETKDKISKVKKELGNAYVTDEMRENTSKRMKNRIKYEPEYYDYLKNHMKDIRPLTTTTKSKEKRIKTLKEKYGVNNAGRLAKFQSYSKISQELFNEIKNRMNLTDCYYATYNGGEKKINFGNCNIFKPDFLYKNVVIEFFGDVYHGNPELFLETDTPNPHRRNMTSKDLWERDERRKNIFENNNYIFLTVWEKEYNSNKEETINKLINKIKEIILCQ